MIAARKMPPLQHFKPGERFDIMQSAAAAWLCEQPEIRQWVWNTVKADGSVVLDLETHTWRGVNFKS